jgi:ABC-type multidrug transport system fused ATPase/permease subunit
MNKDKKDSNIRKLLSYSKKYIKYQKLPIILSPFLLIVSVLSPFLIKYLIDEIIGKNNFSKILPFIFIFIGVVFLERVISFFVNYGYYRATNFSARDEQIYMFKKIQKMPLKDYSQNKVGDFMSRVLSDTLEISFFLGTGISVILYNIIQLIFVSGVLLFLNWKLALITFAMIPFYYFSLRAFDKSLQKSSHSERKAFSELTEEFREKVEGLNSIKSFCKEIFFSNKFSNKSEGWAKTQNKLSMLNQGAEDFMSFVYELTPVLVLGYGGYLILTGNTTLGTLMGFYAYLGWIFTPIRNLSNFYIQMQRAGQVSERIFEIHDLPEEDKGEGKKIIENSYDIKYENIHFKYKDVPVLNGIDINIKSNEKVAIVGTSGAGKSSLVNLVTRFYEPQKGKITINNTNLKEYDLEGLRKNVIIVKQNDYIFNMTLKDNITLGEDFNDEQFEEAIKKAKIDKFIDKLENGYETELGERGNKLSDGQKQRVSIARALIRNPKILILDEATSGVDSQTEEEIFENIKKEKLTLLIISHRLSTIKKADEVIVLKDGQIIGKGTHEELKENTPEYKKIIESQLII